MDAEQRTSPRVDRPSTLDLVRTRLRELFDGVAVTSTESRPRRRDWALAAVLAVSVVLEVAFFEFRWPAATLVVAGVAIGLLPFRRQVPLVAPVAAFLAQFVLALIYVATDESGDTPFGHLIAGFILIYAMCRWLNPGRVALGLAATTTMALLGEAASSSTFLEAAVLTIPWGALALIALSMRYRASLKEQKANEIRLIERNALARELHDSVAHHVSAIAVQAQAGRYVAANDPEAAEAALATVEEIANTTIDEMRRMVGILRSDDDHARTVASSSLESLASSDSKPLVTMSSETDLVSLPVGVRAAVYRIAQESITNARNHNRDISYIDVDMRTTSKEVRLDVINDGIPTTRNSGSGFGLIGMTKRVAALGGSIRTGPRAESGWGVHVTLPIARHQ